MSNRNLQSCCKRCFLADVLNKWVNNSFEHDDNCPVIKCEKKLTRNLTTPCKIQLSPNCSTQQLEYLNRWQTTLFTALSCLACPQGVDPPIPIHFRIFLDLHDDERYLSLPCKGSTCICHKQFEFSLPMSFLNGTESEHYRLGSISLLTQYIVENVLLRRQNSQFLKSLMSWQKQYSPNGELRDFYLVYGLSPSGRNFQRSRVRILSDYNSKSDTLNSFHFSLHERQDSSKDDSVLLPSTQNVLDYLRLRHNCIDNEFSHVFKNMIVATDANALGLTLKMNLRSPPPPVQAAVVTEKWKIQRRSQKTRNLLVEQDASNTCWRVQNDGSDETTSMHTLLLVGGMDRDLWDKLSSHILSRRMTSTSSQKRLRSERWSAEVNLDDDESRTILSVLQNKEDSINQGIEKAVQGCSKMSEVMRCNETEECEAKPHEDKLSTNESMHTSLTEGRHISQERAVFISGMAACENDLYIGYFKHGESNEKQEDDSGGEISEIQLGTRTTKKTSKRRKLYGKSPMFMTSPSSLFACVSSRQSILNVLHSYEMKSSDDIDTSVLNLFGDCPKFRETFFSRMKVGSSHHPPSKDELTSYNEKVIHESARHLCECACYFRLYFPMREFCSFSDDITSEVQQQGFANSSILFTLDLLKGWKCVLTPLSNSDNANQADNKHPGMLLELDSSEVQKKKKSKKKKNIFLNSIKFVSPEGDQLTKNKALRRIRSKISAFSHSNDHTLEIHQNKFRSLTSEIEIPSTPQIVQSIAAINVLLSPLGLLEELFIDNPWRLLLCTILLNKTTRVQVDTVLFRFLQTWPNAVSAAKADSEEIKEVITSLGLMNKRSKSIIRFSKEYLDLVSTKKCTSDGGSGSTKSGSETSSVEFSFCKDDVMRLHNCGEYAWSAYEIFILKRLPRGTVKVCDHALQMYVEYQLGLELCKNRKRLY